MWKVNRTTVFALSLGAPFLVHASQPLETESATVLQTGEQSVEAAVEYQTSSEGTETAFPFVYDYGITDRLELSIEPVLFSTVRPKMGKSASGFGDTEVTLKWLLLPESDQRPAVALGAELKLPTAKDALIGTGKTDYRGFVAGSKRLGRFDLHVNLGYSVLGSPRGTSLDNIYDYAIAIEDHESDALDIVAELLGNSSATGNEPGTIVSGGENQLTPEATGNELVALVGVRYRVRPGLSLAFGATYDNNNALVLRPGFNFAW